MFLSSTLAAFVLATFMTSDTGESNVLMQMLLFVQCKCEYSARSVRSGLSKKLNNQCVVFDPFDQLSFWLKLDAMLIMDGVVF